MDGREDLEWWEQLINNAYKPQMELPEDLYISMARKQPMLDKLIERFDLELDL